MGLGNRVVEIWTPIVLRIFDGCLHSPILDGRANEQAVCIEQLNFRTVYLVPFMATALPTSDCTKPSKVNSGSGSRHAPSMPPSLPDKMKQAES